MRCYRQLEEKDRRRIAKLKSYRLGVSEIARRTGFHKSTISRELKRNGGLVSYDNRETKKMFKQLGYDCYDNVPDKNEYWSYGGNGAHYIAKSRQSKANSRLQIKAEARDWIVSRLKAGWSPQQIAGRSHCEGPQIVSHEFIYKMIVRDKKTGGHLYRLLRRFGKRKQRLGRRDYAKPTIPNRVSITDRPMEANLRLRPGDLEGDIVVGRNSTRYVLTLVDRSSRLVAFELLRSRKMHDVEAAFLRALRKMPAVKTLTLDNAREFACHVSLTKKTGVKVYFADPYCSSQRGSIENANGRYYLPKRMDFSFVTRSRLAQIEEMAFKQQSLTQNSVALRS